MSCALGVFSALKFGDGSFTVLGIDAVTLVLMTFLPFAVIGALANVIMDRKAFVRDVKVLGRYRFFLVDLVGRDIKTKYRRSTLGVLWSVLNPILMM